jgi:hypothetical protein
MAESKERRSTPRRSAQATPTPDSKAAAPRASMPLGGTARSERSGDETRRKIAEAAYFRAKQRNFEPGHELEDWVEAESEVMGRINGSER